MYINMILKKKIIFILDCFFYMKDSLDQRSPAVFASQTSLCPTIFSCTGL